MHRFFEKHREIQRQRAGGEFEGFTLIELLIVIVVLGILAATVIFALGGVTGQSAQAACNSDAKSVEVALEAYKNSPDNTNNTWPNSFPDLTGTGAAKLTNSVTGKTDVFLRAAPNNTTHYAITFASATGIVTVTPTGGGAAGNYDTETSTQGCNAVK